MQRDLPANVREIGQRSLMKSCMGQFIYKRNANPPPLLLNTKREHAQSREAEKKEEKTRVPYHHFTSVVISLKDAFLPPRAHRPQVYGHLERQSERCVSTAATLSSVSIVEHNPFASHLHAAV